MPVFPAADTMNRQRSHGVELRASFSAPRVRCKWNSENPGDSSACARRFLHLAQLGHNGIWNPLDVAVHTVAHGASLVVDTTIVVFAEEVSGVRSPLEALTTRYRSSEWGWFAVRPSTVLRLQLRCYSTCTLTQDDWKELVRRKQIASAGLSAPQYLVSFSDRKPAERVVAPGQRRDGAANRIRCFYCSAWGLGLQTLISPVAPTQIGSPLEALATRWKLLKVPCTTIFNPVRKRSKTAGSGCPPMHCAILAAADRRVTLAPSTSNRSEDWVQQWYCAPQCSTTVAVVLAFPVEMVQAPRATTSIPSSTLHSLAPETDRRALADGSLALTPLQPCLRVQLCPPTCPVLNRATCRPTPAAADNIDSYGSFAPQSITPCRRPADTSALPDISRTTYKVGVSQNLWAVARRGNAERQGKPYIGSRECPRLLQVFSGYPDAEARGSILVIASKQYDGINPT
ncbi:hypothetical protein GGX14DRAFT_386845 [Mycena pura]|uniref:Uncharacterized protein n=1 Tax=Mycena pura TaxID=153505 RepID=A0AAD6YMT4_9AGAR|nr:hypothetical protein GGX14DRAFT_386845 [Mycena pura]